MSPIATSTGTVYQAKDGSALTSAVVLASTTAIISAHTKAAEIQVTLASAVDTSAITVTTYDTNGDAYTALTFTGVPTLGTAGNTYASRYFATNDTASGTAILSSAATNLAACLNHAVYGLKGGAYASATGTAVVLRSLGGGDTSFTFTAPSTANLVCLVKKAIGMIEIDQAAMTISSSFTHLALNVVNESAYHTAAFLIRDGSVRRSRVNVGTLTEL
jgi:hypothetical protein